MYRRAVMPAVVVAMFAAILFVVLPAGASDPVVKATPSHDRYAFGRDVEVRDVINGDLLVLGGNVTFSGKGHVRGNVVYAGGQVIGGEGRIDGQAYPLTTIQGAAASMTRTAVVLSLLFVWLVAAVAVTLASGREVRLSSVEIRASSLHCFVLGLVAFTSFVLTAIMFSYLVPYLIGIPLIAALAVFAILTKIYGMIAVFHAVGTLVAGARTREQLASRKWFRGDVAMVVVGVLILGAIRLIPVVGTLVWSAASVFGIGVALATKFGRREPWFLAWRPAEA
jgi:hypothetical protein